MKSIKNTKKTLGFFVFLTFLEITASKPASQPPRQPASQPGSQNLEKVKNTKKQKTKKHTKQKKTNKKNLGVSKCLESQIIKIISEIVENTKNTYSFFCIF